MNRLTLIQTLVPVLVPVAIAVLKPLVPQLPRRWLPILAPLLGALIDLLATCQLGPGTALGAVLGSAGVGLREILDQVRKTMDPPKPGPGPAAGPTALLLCAALAVSLAACQTADEAAYKTAAGLEAAVDRAMQSWARYVVWRRASAASPEALAELQRQEQTVRQAHDAFRAAMNAAYQARLADAPPSPAGARATQVGLEAARVAAAEVTQQIGRFAAPGVPSSPNPAP